MGQKMVIFDGNSILNRAFYGVHPLITKDGFPTNALFGFVGILFRHLAEGFDYAVIAYDMRAKTFRHIACDTYKANRKGMPEELAKQLPVSKEISRLMGLHVLEKEGFEADDIIGTIAKQASIAGIKTVIVTGDRDSFQLIDRNVEVHLTATNEVKITDYNTIKQLYSLEPSQLIDVKAIMGDSSDNIKGVAGIGEKGALTLISAYASLDGVYQNIDKIKGAAKQKLIDGRDDAYMSRFLAEINTNVPLQKEVLEYTMQPRDDDELLHLFGSLEFSALAKRLNLKKTETPAKAYERVPISAHEMLLLNGELFVQADKENIEIFCDDTLYTLPLDAESATLFESGKQLVFWSVKDTARIILDSGFGFSCRAEDLSLMSYLVSPTDNGLTAEKAVLMYLDISSYDSLLPLMPRLKDILSEELAKTDGEYLYREIELPLAVLLAKTEHKGFLVDGDGLRSFGNMLEKNIQTIEEAIFSYSGETFNINSPKQLGNVLFETLGLAHGKKNKTGYSTDAEVLEKLVNEHPVVSLILEHRMLSKLKSTYADGLYKSIAADGRIHTTFKQTLTKTGRLSSTEPNLQNIPVRTELGREMRKFFIAPEGYTLIDADYSQIELRILAHISGDINMLRAFENGDDIHTITASQIFHVSPEAVTRELRKRAKAINFGIVYGIGGYSLANDIGVSKKRADEYISNYLQTYPGIANYLERVKAQAKQDGYVTTLYGRRRYIPELSSGKKSIVSFGERVAMNTPIQGTAADIMKKAMVDTAKELERRGLGAAIIMQIHDELIVEAPETEAAEATLVLMECMEKAFSLSVPLTVDAHSGKNWFMAKND